MQRFGSGAREEWKSQSSTPSLEGTNQRHQSQCACSCNALPAHIDNFYTPLRTIYTLTTWTYRRTHFLGRVFEHLPSSVCAGEASMLATAMLITGPSILCEAHRIRRHSYSLKDLRGCGSASPARTQAPNSISLSPTHRPNATRVTQALWRKSCL